MMTNGTFQLLGEYVLMTFNIPGVDEYPVRSPEEYNSEDDPIRFLDASDNSMMFPPPEPISAFTGERTKNFQKDTPIPGQDHQLLEDSSVPESVITGYHTGYILPAPVDIPIVSETGGEINLAKRVRKPGCVCATHQLDGTRKNDSFTIVTINTHWTVTAPDEYVLLCFHPVMLDTKSAHVAPQIIDPAVGPVKIRCSIIVTGPGELISHGDPLMQIVPMKKQGDDLEMVVESTPQR